MDLRKINEYKIMKKFLNSFNRDKDFNDEILTKPKYTKKQFTEELKKKQTIPRKLNKKKNK